MKHYCWSKENNAKALLPCLCIFTLGTILVLIWKGYTPRIPIKANGQNTGEDIYQLGYAIQPQGKNERIKKLEEDNHVLKLQGENRGEPDQFGYVVAAEFSDQMTVGSKNILALQCWAATVSSHMKVVEPFIRFGSRFGYDLENVMETNQTSTDTNLVRFRDVYDIVSWEKQTRKRRYAPLITWELFLEQAPQNLIVVGTRIRDSSSWNTFKQLVQSFADQHNFKVVRLVDYTDKVYSPEEFKYMVYGKYFPRHSTVLFNNWGGIVSYSGKSYRIAMSNMKICGHSLWKGFLLQNSQHIKIDGLQYQSKYLSQARLYGYISVMLRIERFALYHDFKNIQSDAKKLQMLGTCVENISNYVSKVKKKYGIKSIFLAMDCRKHGTKVFRSSSPQYLSRELVDKITATLYQKLYGNSSSLEEWDKSFDSITSFKAPGYVAQLQKYLAYKGVCLLTAGGGDFQESAIKLYNQKHQSSSVHCAIRIPEC